MPVDNTLMLLSLAKTFNQTLGVDICDDTKTYIKSTSKIFSKLTNEEKIYYTKYSMVIAQSLSSYLEKISLFELNTDPEDEIIHDFKLTWKKDNIAHISLEHNTINTRDIIPEKLMKICKYKRNTKLAKAYLESYQKINDDGYKKIQSNTKYSEVKDKPKNKIILNPMKTLVFNTLSKKRKCASHLYDHLFGESDRIVFRLYKTRFVMYDFGKELDDVESFKMKIDPENITVTFNNGAEFALCLITNATEIKPHLSLKFKSTFCNMDELFSIEKKSV